MVSIPAAVLILATGIVGLDDQPPKLSADAKKASSELKAALPAPKSRVMSSAKLSQAMSGLPATVRGARLTVVDSLPEAFFLGKVVSTLKFYAAKKDSETVKARLATVRKMVEKSETIAMVDFLSKGASPDVVSSAPYLEMLNDLSGVVQAEIKAKNKAYVGLYWAGLVALFMPLEAPLTAAEIENYAGVFTLANMIYGPFPGVAGVLMKQLSTPNEAIMLSAMAKLEAEMKM